MKKYYYMNIPIFIYILFTVWIGLDYFDVAEQIKGKLFYLNIVLSIMIVIGNRLERGKV